MDFDSIDWLGILGKVLLAILILVVTLILAKVAKWAIAKLISKVPALQHKDASGATLGSSVGQIVSLLIWLLGLVALLELFGLNQVLEPLQGLLGGFVAFLPRLVGAILVFFIGWKLAGVARDLTVSGLSAVGLDRRVAGWTGKGEAAHQGQHPQSQHPQAQHPQAQQQFQQGQFHDQQQVQGQHQPQQHSGQSSVSSSGPTGIIAGIVFGIIVILIAVAALQILGIAALYEPATQMLSTITTALPSIISAVALLALGVVAANFIGKILQSVLAGTGLDRAAAKAGLPEERKASDILTLIVKIAIVLFFAIMATQLLNFPQVTELLNEVLVLGGNVLFGAAIVVAGVVIASLLKKVLGNGLTGKIVSVATIVLFVAMGLKFMGLADSIINMAFGALVIGGAAAAALAFGLGGRETAARTLAKIEAGVEAEQAKEAANPPVKGFDAPETTAPRIDQPFDAGNQPPFDQGQQPPFDGGQSY